MVHSDEKINELIVERLTLESRIDISKIIVEVENGKVTLSGEVPTADAQSSANWITTSIEGVTDVINHLTVRRPATLTMPDDEN